MERWFFIPDKKRKLIYLLILFSLIIIACSIKTSKAFPPPDDLRPGDFIYAETIKYAPEFWKWAGDFGDLISAYGSPHIIMYEKETCPLLNRHRFIHSILFGGVQYTNNFYIQRHYRNITFHYVIDATQQNREDAVLWAIKAEKDNVPYQLTFGTETNGRYRMGWVNYNLDDIPPDKHADKLHCAELIWGAYMDATEGEYQINIIDPEEYISQVTAYDDSPTWQGYCVGVTIFDSEEFPNNPEVDAFEPENSPFSKPYVESIVDCNLPANDPDNYKWTSIQEAVDNLSSCDIINVKSGTYAEDIYIDKSLIINGEDRESTIIEGSITMSNTFDYELPELGDSDWNKFVNMTGNEVLLHFNNETDVGEDYATLSLVYDHTGWGNNATFNYATWNTSSELKGAGSFDFDGTDDYINLSSVSALAGENVTAYSWIYWNGGSGDIDPIISQLDSQNNGYCLYINSSTNKPVFRLNDTEAISSVEVESGWHNIVGTHNKTTLKIYMDGNLINAASKDGFGTSSEAFVGFDNISSYFKGTIDEIAVWNRTLSDDEIARLYKLSYGISISDLTIKNSTIGVSLYNCSEIYNCNLINHTIGINVDNKTSVFIYNVSFIDCDKGIQINNSHPIVYDDCRELILVGKCNITASTGISVNSSSNMGIVLSYFNCSNINLEFNDCDISTIGVENCTSFNNSSPDTPILSGPTLGDPNTAYTYYSCTNDSDNDQIWYQFDWDDGNTTDWLGPYISNETVNAPQSWANEGGYYVRVKSKDVFNNESEWSDSILFRTEILPPLINSVENSPNLVGFGYNVTITSNVTDDKSGNWSGVKTVKVNITYPNDTSGNFTMDDVGNNIFEYTFCDTWLVGQYNYTIRAIDNAENTNVSSQYSFNVSANATISVCTIKDKYGNNEIINITDPPTGGGNNGGYDDWWTYPELQICELFTSPTFNWIKFWNVFRNHAFGVWGVMLF